MLSLLEKNEQEIITVLSVFFSHPQKKRWTLNELHNETNLSQWKITQALEGIQRIIEHNNWQDRIQLEWTANEVIAYLKKNISMDFIRKHLYKSSIIYNLCLEALLNPGFNLYRFLDEYGISYSTLYRRLKPLKKMLKEFNLCFTLKADSLIQGEEAQIRYFLYFFLIEAYNTDFLKTYKTSIVDRGINHFSVSHDASFSQQKRLKVFLIITHNRILNNHLIESFHCPNRTDALLSHLHEHFHQFFDLLNLPSEAKRSEAQFAAFFLFSIDGFSKKRVAEQLTTAELDGTTQTTQKLLAFIQDYFAITFTPEDTLFLTVNIELLLAHASFFSGCLLIADITMSDYLTSNFFFIGNNFLLSFIAFVQEQMSVKNKDFFCFNVLPIVSETLAGYIKTSINILLVSSISKTFEDTLKKMISDISPLPVNFVHQHQSIDLIITDSYNGLYEAFPETKYFCWSYIPTEEDWQRLKTSLLSLAKATSDNVTRK
ncbi:helix-turn-helix domain-containing protein [Vagococcus acidifermentans]|uniref:Mga helix-turn-helix domain-containing protein n=1 Tax=Vagococcus acidifermentans TaxID=564710 RepID=A0A430AT37_9ENTE|nr:helix-turn-helix domain-containing protein [Vagococcus acidifermentans]RSU11224.1 hypothetical protein CBF27_08995 [Vagococcus acidifermentans]